MKATIDNITPERLADLLKAQGERDSYRDALEDIRTHANFSSSGLAHTIVGKVDEALK